MAQKKNIKKKKVVRKVTKVEDIKNISPLPAVPEKKEPKTESHESLDDIWDNDDFDEDLDMPGDTIDTGKADQKWQSKKIEPKWTESQLDIVMEMCQWYAKALENKAAYKKLKDGVENMWNNCEKKLMWAAFMAMPETEHIPQYAFAARIGIKGGTLSEWRSNELVMKARDEIMYFHFKKHTPKVIRSLFEGTQSKNWKTGEKNVQAIKLFMQVVEKWSERVETDLRSDGKRIGLMLWSSQFLKPGKVKEEEPSDEK